jgi:hypothetical protein
MKIPTNLLLIVACVVWCIAGVNVCIIGIESGVGTWTPLMLILSLVVFVAFLAMFLAITNRNAKRIAAMTQTHMNLFRFMDVRAYCIMVFMIALGLILRIFSLVPSSFIALFYTGLGSALALAGVAYLIIFINDYSGAKLPN